jgi:hypothetical protein
VALKTTTIIVESGVKNHINFANVTIITDVLSNILLQLFKYSHQEHFKNDKHI